MLVRHDIAKCPPKTHHVINNLVDFADGKLQYQVDRLVVMISTLYVGHGVLGLDAIPSGFYASVSGYCIFLFHHSEAYYLISVVDQLVYEPL